MAKSDPAESFPRTGVHQPLIDWSALRTALRRYEAGLICSGWWGIRPFSKRLTAQTIPLLRRGWLVRQTAGISPTLATLELAPGNRPRPVRSDDLGAIFSESNAFGRCGPASRDWLLEELTRQREKLAELTLTKQDAETTAAFLPPGAIYVVKQGRAVLEWEAGLTHRVFASVATTGETLGDLQLGVASVRPLTGGVHLRPLLTRSTRSSVLIEIPAAVTTVLLGHQPFERALLTTGLEKYRDLVAPLTFMALGEPGLAVAAVCLSPRYGVECRSDSRLEFLGQAAVTQKVITYDEICGACGMTTNSARAAIKSWVRVGALSVAPDRVSGSTIVVEQPRVLLDDLRRCGF